MVILMKILIILKCLVLQLTLSMQVSRIPSLGAPPNKRYDNGAVLDRKHNRIITFGGFDTSQKHRSPDIHEYDLSTRSWSTIIPHSRLSPGISNFQMYLREYNKFLIFFGEMNQGISSEVFSFDLETRAWMIEKLTGDKIPGRFVHASTEFIDQNNQSFVAIFGGYTHDGINNDLFL